MEDRDTVDIVFMGTIQHPPPQTNTPEKNSHQDQIAFKDPVQIQLIRIPHHGRDLYKRMVAMTQVKNSIIQKEPLKSLEIYYRNLDKPNTRFSLLTRSSSELLVSSTSDILLTLRETIYTDLLVIRGNFTTITLCIYGRLHKEPDQNKFPYFFRDVEAPLETPVPSLVINENIWEHSMETVKALEKQASKLMRREDRAQKLASLEARDSVFHEQQIKNISKLSRELLGFIGMDTIQESVLAEVRSKMDDLQGNLSKLLKSAHIGLYYPPNYMKSIIPLQIPTDVVQTCIRLLSLNLSDQFRSLEVLKLILQLQNHAQEFFNKGGISVLIGLFLQFFNSEEVILSSLKSLLIEVFVALSFWDFSAGFFVSDIKNLLFKQQKEISNQDPDNSNQKSEESEKDRERSRQKKKKKSRSESSEEKGKKSKKSKKKDKDKRKDRKKDRDASKQKQKGKGKDKKGTQKQKQKPKIEQTIPTEPKIDLSYCTTFYQVLLMVMKAQKNFKLLHLLKILIQQITQTLTRNPHLSDQMALHTPLMRDVKYMFNQGVQIIGSKPLKMFVSFQPFLNEFQSRGVKSEFVCESQKIINCSHGIDPFLFSLIHEANMILSSRAEALHRIQGEQINLTNDKDLFSLNEKFMGLMSSLIGKNQSGVTIGFNSFVEALKLDSLLHLKKHEAAIAMICEYIHEVLLEEDGTNLVYYMDQVHAAMLKISGWLKEDKTFSREIKRKVQYLINTVFTYNNFSGSENAFKTFADYFVKLTGHQNFEINKIIEYAQKESDRSINHGDFGYLSDHFEMGNFYEVLPNQPLLEIDICLKMFLILLKFNRNIWTMFYQHKLVTSFSSMFIKMHSLLSFFLTPTLPRQNTLITFRRYENTIQDYLQVTKHITDLFVHKVKYQSAFNELTEEQDIFDNVEMYEKSIELYIILFGAEDDKNLMLSENKTATKINKVLANIIEMFDNVLKAYEYTKHSSRESKIKNILLFIYKYHYQSILNRTAVFSLFRTLISRANTHSSEVIKSFMFTHHSKKTNNPDDILLPNNDKSPFENLVTRNMYRGDQKLLTQLSGFISEVIKKSAMKEQACSIIQNILVDHELKTKEHLEDHESHDKLRALQKLQMFVRLLGGVSETMSPKLHDQMLRIFKWSSGLKNFHDYSSEDFQLRKLKLRNAFFPYFQNLFAQQNQLPIFLQVIRFLPTLLIIKTNSQKEHIRCEQLKGCLGALKVVNAGVGYGYYASVLLYGDFFEQPNRPSCEISLHSIFTTLCEKQNWNSLGQPQTELFNQIAVCGYYLLVQLTFDNGSDEYFSTQSRKNAINALISTNPQLTIEKITKCLQGILPACLMGRMTKYLEHEIIQKNQSISGIARKETEQARGSMFSRIVFTMISENDAIGKTRFEFIQDQWEGGDVEGKVCLVNKRENYLEVVQQMKKLNNKFDCFYETVEDQGLHVPSSINPLFAFKIKKIFAIEPKRPANTTVFIKTIPDVIIKPEEPTRELPRPYQPPPYQPPQNSNMSNPNLRNQISPQQPIRSNSNNRDHSPYNNQPNNNVPRAASNPTYPQPTNNVPYYGKANYQPPHTASQYTQPPYDPSKQRFDYPAQRGYQAPRSTYDQRPGYDQRGYYPPSHQPHMPQGPIQNYYPHTAGYGNPGGRYAPPPPSAGYANPYGSQMGVYRSEREMTDKAIQLLLYVRSQGNMMDRMQRERITAEVNLLVKNPNVKVNVERYFGR